MKERLRDWREVGWSPEIHNERFGRWKNIEDYWFVENSLIYKKFGEKWYYWNVGGSYFEDPLARLIIIKGLMDAEKEEGTL